MATSKFFLTHHGYTKNTAIHGVYSMLLRASAPPRFKSKKASQILRKLKSN